MSPQELPPGLILILKNHNIHFATDLFIRDWTDQVEIYKPHKLVWIVDPSTAESRVFASPTGDTWFSLNKPANVSILNRDLVEPDLGASETAGILSQRLTALLYDPRVLLCEPGFASWPESILKTYLAPGGQSLDTLRSACQTPPALRHSANKWALTARLMDWRGAILDVEYTGSSSPFQVNTMNMTEAMHPGSFNFADEF
ncbi:MAG: hypothetical protein K5905_02415 [Roseibium sp.]|uniref:hypothetical protein n=1 Tax=Roseibium sp. TaxID=1936156 RepID=UPI002611D394|nr:hypothetical protein [Roseibium sp.]MCV0424302.1 hypothetical protein [Roseibium sp.]